MNPLGAITVSLNAREIGARIRKARKGRKWQQRDLGRVVGVAKSTVCCWECGVRIPPRDMMIALSLVLRRKLTFLLFGRRGRP